MVKEDKKTAVKEITKKIESAELIIFSSYKKLTVAGDRELRRKLRSANAEYKVYKNTLTKLALKKLNIAINEKTLEGPTSFIFSKEPVAPAKALVDFAKTNEAVGIKGGIYLGKEISAAQIKELASLPSREELLSKLVYLLQYPITGFVRVIHGPLRKFVYAINGIKDKK
jgi:large subunit ribosomal protein L10